MSRARATSTRPTRSTDRRSDRQERAGGRGVMPRPPLMGRVPAVRRSVQRARGCRLRGRRALTQPSLALVVPGLRAVCDPVARPGRPGDVLALVTDAPLERERRAERGCRPAPSRARSAAVRRRRASARSRRASGVAVDLSSKKAIASSDSRSQSMNRRRIVSLRTVRSGVVSRSHR